MQMSPHDIAVATNYLRPMSTSTNVAAYSTDTTDATERLAEAFANVGITVARAAIGGENPALAVEELAEMVGGDAKVLIIEVEAGTDKTNAALRALYEAAVIGTINSQPVGRDDATALVLVMGDDPKSSMPQGPIQHAFIHFEVKDAIPA